MTGLTALRASLLVLAAAATLNTVAGEDARDWLDRMGRAVELTNYRGTFVHIHSGDQMESMEVMHRVDGDRVWERLVSLDGSGREIIRNNDEVRCIFQADKSVLVDWRRDQSPLRAALPAYTKELDQYYKFVYGGSGDRVAKLETRFIAVKPRDEYRYGYRLWLETRSAMPLRSQLVSENDTVIETIQFSEIVLNKTVPMSEFRPSVSTEDYSVVERLGATRSSADARWQPTALPRGFNLSVANRESIGDGVVEHHVYTDGLAAVSVFVEELRRDQKAMHGATRIGAASAFGREVDGYQVTAVGEVPGRTVKMISEGMKQRR